MLLFRLFEVFALLLVGVAELCRFHTDALHVLISSLGVQEQLVLLNSLR